MADEKDFGKYNNPLDLSYFDNGEFADFTYGNGKRDAATNMYYPNADARKEAYWKTQNDYSSLGKDDLNGWNKFKQGLHELGNAAAPDRAFIDVDADNAANAKRLAQSQPENQPNSQKYYNNYRNAVMNQKRDVEQRAFDAMMADRQAHYGAPDNPTPNAMANDSRYASPEAPAPEGPSENSPSFGQKLGSAFKDLANGIMLMPGAFGGAF